MLLPPKAFHLPFLPPKCAPLTVDEILGNIFVFNFAGHDTTALSLASSMLLLVARPDVQEWMAEELNFYLKSGSSETWKYEEVFPKLRRCLAVLVRPSTDELNQLLPHRVNAKTVSA